MTAPLENLLVELGYRQSSFYREDVDGPDLAAAHLLRDAKRAHVCGSYFIQTTAGHGEVSRKRPAVHVAEAKTVEEARQIHKRIWNQGTTPFLLISLPGQVRVYTGFAYDESNEAVGRIEKPVDTDNLTIGEVARRLEFLCADSIDSGQIWQTKGNHLTKDKRVDRSLLRTLRSLSRQLVRRHHLAPGVAHALIGRFVYLHYLRERDILSDPWLSENGIDPDAIFSANARLNAFRHVTDKVDEKFNGRIFPIDWSSNSAPNADCVRAAAQAFSGEDPDSAQMHLPFRAFDFSFIPIELLSAIYEQFLHDEGNGAKEGAFYTSEPVADYLLAEVETVKPFAGDVKVLDPSCGSGIFLVLAYRRLVEQELRRRKTHRLPPAELREILTGSIFGVERNSEACLVTEFSLILTMLSYVDPPELHRHAKFKFPTLHNEQIFQCDFFDNNSAFWKASRKFDCIVGNPPWVELDPKDQTERTACDWIQQAQESGTTPVARYRTSEAFTWRVREKLADDGVAGLITQATSLTNDQSDKYRRAFFIQNTVHRITNFSNLAYVLFESAEEPAANLIYSKTKPETARADIVHFGPLVVNQPATAPGPSRRRRTPWVLTICESEIQTISAEEAARGEATTWKRALWGNPRDRRVLERLRRILPSSLGAIADQRNWHLNLGLQLRADEGKKSDPNQREASLAGLRVIEPKKLKSAAAKLTVQDSWLVRNRWGTFIRKGRDAGLEIIHGPHLFLWNEFAAFSDQDFIFRHPKLGLSAPREDADWLRAISVVWTSSITPYCLFLDLSAGWGISRSTIDLGDAGKMPMPEFTPQQITKLAELHQSLVTEEKNLADRAKWQQRLDDSVVAILGLPSQAMLLAREFNQFRLPLVKGKAPRSVTRNPDQAQLESYARRLKSELDGFLERKKQRHRVTVTVAPGGIVATVELVSDATAAKAVVRSADEAEQNEVRLILQAAAHRMAQWVYVRRSVRVFAGNKIHICKPQRRLEWTETQALLDAADIIAEVAETRGRNA